MYLPLRLAQPCGSTGAEATNEGIAPADNVTISRPLRDDAAYLLRLCEAVGDQSVQMRGDRLARILRRLLELEAA